MPEIADKILLEDITLAVDAGGYSVANIEFAVEMAIAFNSRVHGLFVEDIDLLHIADLPFSTEITLSTAHERRLDTLSMQRSLRAQSLQFRNYLAQTAERFHIQWSFETVRGRKMEASLSGLENAGLMIIGQAKSHRQPPSRKLRKKRILLFDDEAANLLQVLEVIMSLAAEIQVELTVVRPQGKPESPLLRVLEETEKETANLILNKLEEEVFLTLAQQSTIAVDYVIVSRNQTSAKLKSVMESIVSPIILMA